MRPALAGATPREPEPDGPGVWRFYLVVPRFSSGDRIGVNWVLAPRAGCIG